MSDPQNTIDLERLRRQLEHAARTTFCSVCEHPLNRHWINTLKVEDENGNRRYCVVSGCTCIPSWVVDA